MFTKLKKIFMLGLVLSFCSCYFGNAKAFDSNELSKIESVLYEARNQCMDSEEEDIDKLILMSNWICASVTFTKCLKDSSLIYELRTDLKCCISEIYNKLHGFEQYKLLCDFINCDYKFCLECFSNDAYVQSIIDSFCFLASKFLDNIGYGSI